MKQANNIQKYSAYLTPIIVDIPFSLQPSPGDFAKVDIDNNFTSESEFTMDDGTIVGGLYPLCNIRNGWEMELTSSIDPAFAARWIVGKAKFSPGVWKNKFPTAVRGLELDLDIQSGYYFVTPEESRGIGLELMPPLNTSFYPPVTLETSGVNGSYYIDGVESTFDLNQSGPNALDVEYFNTAINDNFNPKTKILSYLTFASNKDLNIPNIDVVLQSKNRKFNIFDGYLEKTVFELVYRYIAASYTNVDYKNFQVNQYHYDINTRPRIYIENAKNDMLGRSVPIAKNLLEDYGKLHDTSFTTYSSNKNSFLSYLSPTLHLNLRIPLGYLIAETPDESPVSAYYADYVDFNPLNKNLSNISKNITL